MYRPLREQTELTMEHDHGNTVEALPPEISVHSKFSHQASDVAEIKLLNSISTVQVCTYNDGVMTKFTDTTYIQHCT